MFTYQYDYRHLTVVYNGEVIAEVDDVGSLSELHEILDEIMSSIHC